MTKNPQETTGTKVCKLCGVSKPLTDFAPEPRGADGRRNTCRSCRYQQGKEKKKQYRAENRDRILKQRRDRFNSQRDLTKLLVCSWCAKSFYPLKGSYGQSAMFCSKSCSSRANLHRINRQVGSAALLTPLPIRVETRYSGAEPVTSTADAMTVVKEKSESWRESGEHWDAVARWFAERQQAEQKRRAEQNSAYDTVAGEGRTVVLAGYGARISIKAGNLFIKHGRSYGTEDCPSEVLYKGIHGVSSLLWLVNGGAGSLSTQSLKWLAGQNITVRFITTKGEHMGTIYPATDAPGALGIPGQPNGKPDMRLRRAQYALAPSGEDIPLARAIILRKLVAQRTCLDRHPEIPDRQRAYDAIEIAATWLSTKPPTPATSSLNGIRLYEARASKGYFAGWQGLPLKVDSKAAKSWPPPWLTFAERQSPLTRWKSPRNATNPAQSVLNFCYAMLASQIGTALHAVGADLACGVLHADLDGRDSLVYDVMEALRGEVDHLILEFVKSHVFGLGDFVAQDSGAVVIHPSLCRVLAEACRLPQRNSDDEARLFRRQLLEAK